MWPVPCHLFTDQTGWDSQYSKWGGGGPCIPCISCISSLGPSHPSTRLSSPSTSPSVQSNSVRLSVRPVQLRPSVRLSCLPVHPSAPSALSVRPSSSDQSYFISSFLSRLSRLFLSFSLSLCLPLSICLSESLSCPSVGPSLSVLLCHAQALHMWPAHQPLNMITLSRHSRGSGRVCLGSLEDPVALFCHSPLNCLGALEDWVMLFHHSRGSSHGPACTPAMILCMPKCTHAMRTRTITHREERCPHTHMPGKARLRRHTNGCMHVHQDPCTYARPMHERMHAFKLNA